MRALRRGGRRVHGVRRAWRACDRLSGMMVAAPVCAVLLHDVFGSLRFTVVLRWTGRGGGVMHSLLGPGVCLPSLLCGVGLVVVDEWMIKRCRGRRRF